MKKWIFLALFLSLNTCSLQLGENYEVFTLSRNGLDYYQVQVYSGSIPIKDLDSASAVFTLDGNFLFSQVYPIVDRLHQSGDILPLVVISIGYAEGINPDIVRFNDYTPSSDPQLSQVTGGLESFLDDLENLILPAVYSRYSISTNRSEHALVGWSLSGLAAFYLALQRPGNFGTVIASSPSLQWDGGMIFSIETNYAISNTNLSLNLFLGSGSLEAYGMNEYCTEMFQRLSNRNYQDLSVTREIMRARNHNSAVPEVIERGLIWAYGVNP